MAEVQMRSIYKSFGNTEVIHGVDLEIEDHEFVVFVGLPAAVNQPSCALLPVWKMLLREKLKLMASV